MLALCILYGLAAPANARAQTTIFRDHTAAPIRMGNAAQNLSANDIEAINSGVDARLIANPIVADDLRALARHFGGDRGRDAFAAVDRALSALERNVGAKVVAEWLSLQL